MAEELLNQIEAYWSTRPEGYSEVNEKELAGEQKRAWLSVLEEHFPAGEKRKRKILDVGTGPGFFPVILARAGYAVTAVDYTPGMLSLIHIFPPIILKNSCLQLHWGEECSIWYPEWIITGLPVFLPDFIFCPSCFLWQYFLWEKRLMAPKDGFLWDRFLSSRRSLPRWQ